MKYDWKYDEFRQIGKDYSEQQEVDIYEQTHSEFRDLKKESRELLASLSTSNKEVLMDIGCGTGVFALEASKKYNRVFAVDVSETMLNYAAHKACQLDISNITFMHAGFLNLNIKALSVNTITSTYALHHLPDYWKSVALKNVHSMLKADGTFYLKDVVIPDYNPEKSIESFILEQEKRGGDFLKNDAIVHFKEEYSTYEWILENLLERSGFTIHSKHCTHGVIAEYYCKKRVEI